MATSLLPGVVLGAETNVAGMLAGGCLAAGLVLTAIGSWQRRTVLRLVAEGRRTVATAVDSVLHPTEGGADTHHVVWRFETPDGTAFEHEGLASGVHHPAQGETATIIYDPSDPHLARLETTAERTLAWALFLCTGLALLAIGLIAAVVALVT
jgi:hypothetical protein